MSGCFAVIPPTESSTQHLHGAGGHLGGRGQPPPFPAPNPVVCPGAIKFVVGGIDQSRRRRTADLENPNLSAYPGRGGAAELQGAHFSASPRGDASPPSHILPHPALLVYV